MNRSGRSVDEARRVIEIDEVFEASRVLAPRWGRLDRQVGGADQGQVLGGGDPRQGRAHRRLVDDPAMHLAGHVLFDQGQAGVDALARDVVQAHVIAAKGDDMSDARPHLARADHADRLDIRHSGKPC